MSGRKFFITKAGRMGLGPAEMRPGDVVCVLFGSPTPFLLRRTTVVEEFKFVGECYVNGLMNGEAFEVRPEGIVPIALV